MPAIKSDAPELVQKLLDLLLESENYGERKGAAYGLAGLVRGLGITALKQLEIMTTLEEAVKDKKNPRRREGISHITRNLSWGFPTKSDTKWAIQPQEMVKGLRFFYLEI